MVALLGCSTAAAETAGIPPKLQAALFKKIFAYDKTLSGKELKVAVVGSGDAREIVAAFGEAGIAATGLKADQLAGAAADAPIVYVMPGSESAAVTDFCTKARALCVSSGSTGAESGAVAVGIGRKADGRPEIIINLGRAKAEGHDFSAELLRLAKVIQ